MSRERLTYRFGPLERRGLLGPLRLGQVAVVGASLLIGVELLDRVGGGAGVVAALLLLVAALGVTTAPISGRTVEEWAPVAASCGVRHLLWQHRFRARAPTSGRSVTRAPQLELPRSLRGVQLGTVGHQGRELGVLSERRGRWLTSVLACQALSFALLDPEVQERRLAQWGMLLAGAANAPIRRLQWIERTAPAQGDELARWLHTARDPTIAARGTPAVESYLELIGQSTQVTHDHEILLAVQLDSARLHGSAELQPEQIHEQVGQVVRGLEAAEIRVLGALNAGQLARVLRTGFDPYSRAELGALDALTAGAHRFGQHNAGPLAVAEAWDHYRCDGSLHATHWISGWPRTDVSPMFMDALLANSDTVRTVALIFEPVAPERSAREVEAAITRDRADSELRRRFGQSETARQRLSQESAARREAELAAGHGEVRFSGFVTVSGRDDGELRRACAEIHRHAARARLELRRMYGQQAEAFSFTLPLARGLR
jgi:hypothetical protein